MIREMKKNNMQGLLLDWVCWLKNFVNVLPFLVLASMFSGCAQKRSLKTNSGGVVKNEPVFGLQFMGEKQEDSAFLYGVMVGEKPLIIINRKKGEEPPYEIVVPGTGLSGTVRVKVNADAETGDSLTILFDEPRGSLGLLLERDLDFNGVFDHRARRDGTSVINEIMVDGKWRRAKHHNKNARWISLIDGKWREVEFREGRWKKASKTGAAP